MPDMNQEPRGEPRGGPGVGSLCLPMLLVPVAYVCSQLLPVGSASFIALVRVGMALLMGRWLLLVLTTPNFIPFPYTSSPTSEHAKPVVVIFAASFNPPHVGHLDILEYLSTTADKVYAVIAVNTNKTYVVSGEDRQRLLETMLAEVGLSEKVEVVVCSEYVWQFGKRVGAKVLYRGVRSWEQDGKAERYLEWLNTIGPITIGKTMPIPTYYLGGNPAFQNASSTLLRARAINGEEVSELVPPGCAAAVLQLYGKKST